MKKKVSKNRFPELDKFDKKQRKHNGSRQKSSKQKMSIYNDFDEDEYNNTYSSNPNDIEE